MLKRFNRKYYASATLVLSVIMCGVISFCGYSLAKLVQVTNNSIDASVIARKANILAESELNAVAATSYAMLVGYPRKQLGPDGFDSEVVLGPEEVYGDNKKRTVTVKIYGSESDIPYASYTKTVFSSHPGLYTEIGENEDKGMTQKAISDAMKYAAVAAWSKNDHNITGGSANDTRDF